MVQPSFSTAGQASSSSSTSPTLPLDTFLDGQHQSYYEELYRSSAVCLCVLRLLPPVCSQIIMHNIWSYGAIRAADLKQFCQIDIGASLQIPEELLKPALSRKILHPIQHKKNRMEWPFNDAFKTGLRNALTGLGTTNGFGVPFEQDPEEEIPTQEQLIAYGEDTWEAILKYMVSSGLDGGVRAQKPRKEVLQLLHASGLMSDPYSTDERYSLDRLTITSKGFQFLLEERQTQLWQILIYYLTLQEQTDQRSAIVLSVFFSLGCMQLGTAYSASQSFPDALAALEDLESYGFIYRPRDETGQPGDEFYPTHLATSLCSGDIGSLGSQTADEKRFLILETNYKIYAYTSNELEIAILNLFVDIKIRYPNLVVGKLDRTHVKAAMEKGISAHQIISYLASHAHPQMYSSPPPLLHPTIVDQLHLWDRERNRLKTEDAVCFQFYSKELFEDTLAEAKRYDGLLLSLPDQKYLVIAPEIREAIRDFVKNMQNELRGL